MKKSFLKKVPVFFLTALFLFAAAFPVQASARDQLRERARDRDRVEVNKSLKGNDGFKLRLEAELENETEAGLSDEELPATNDQPGLLKQVAKTEGQLARDPDNTKLLHRLAVYYRNLGEYDKAIETCKKILGLEPANQQALVLLALSYRAKGEIDKALEELQKLLAEKETVGHSVYAYLGILHEAVGNLKEAVESVEKAVYEAGYGNKEYCQKLGELYARANIKGVKIFIRGHKITPDVPPFIENGRTMVPVRAVAEALGLEVKYENGTVLITNPSNGKTVVLFIGGQKARVGGQEITLDAATQIKGNRTFVPLRFVAQALGAGVDYVPDGQVVTVD
jgi:tetratricopeptide (TPR) repeat protein